MAPYFERAHGVVGPDIETRARVVRPRQPVRDVFDNVVEVGAGREIAEVERVPLAPVRVDGVCGDRVIGRHFESAEREIVVAGGQLVLVE